MASLGRSSGRGRLSEPRGHRARVLVGKGTGGELHSGETMRLLLLNGLIGLGLFGLTSCGHTLYGVGLDWQRLRDRVDPNARPATPSHQQVPSPAARWDYYR